MKKITALILVFAISLVISSFVFVSFAQENVGGGEIVGTLEATVCCEKTNSGLFCQDVPVEDCASDRKPPTACESTSFCKPGWCFDSNEGTCLDNTAQIVCNDNGGTWSEEEPPQCSLGCCVLDDEAAFVTLVRCKKLSGYAGIETNWDSSIIDEQQCILSAGNKEKGACVFEEDFEKTCKIMTRESCDESVLGGGIAGEAQQSANERTTSPFGGSIPSGENSNGAGTNEGENSGANSNEGETNPENTVGTGAAILSLVSAQDSNGRIIPAGCEARANGVFFCPGKLCTDEELGTNCAPTRNTICQEGKEEVYFVDTCGNPANVYDAGKINDDTYWANIIKKEDSCSPGASNENSQTCGNCNYLLGSYCREAVDVQPTYGSNICQSLNCVDSQGKGRIHGESWCIYDGGSTGAPGSRFYRQLCINGAIRVEACADFRQEECIEDSSGGFSQAACRVNRWQDCTGQREKEECENLDKRDCKWLDGIGFVLMGSILNGTTVDGNSLGGIAEAIHAQGGLDEIPRGGCVPKIPPGFNQQTDEASGICAQANAVCPVTFTKGLIDDEWECEEHCECLPGGSLEKQRVELCTSLGDCGPKTNFVGQKGSGKGYKTTQKELDDDE